MRNRKDPFRTLDDPEPAPAAGELTAEAIAEAIASEKIAASGSITSDQIKASVLTSARVTEVRSLGYWQMWPAGRPSRLRRALVRLVLGGKWREGCRERAPRVSKNACTRRPSGATFIRSPATVTPRASVGRILICAQ